MGGLIVLSVLAAWASGCASAAAWIMRRLPLRQFRTTAGVSIFCILFVFPVSDELIARPQFNALCRQGAVLRIDAQKIKGRMVRLDISPENRHLEGTIIPILYSRFSYRDVTSEEELAWYEVYAAKGGFMARWTGFPEGGNPWTIENSVCVPPNEGSISKRYGFTLTN